MSRIAKHCEGASAVEFSLVLPVVAALVLGGIEFGLVTYSQNTMQSVTGDVARKLAVNDYDHAAAREGLRDHLPGWIRNNADVDIRDSAPGDPLNNVITVDVVAAAEIAGILSLYTRMLGDRTISASVAMKQEDRV